MEGHREGGKGKVDVQGHLPQDQGCTDFAEAEVVGIASATAEGVGGF